MAACSWLPAGIKHYPCPASVLLKAASRSTGFSLFEILLAMVLVALTVVPMMEAFSPGRAVEGGEEAAVFTNQVRGTLNRIAAYDYEVLDSYVAAYGGGTMNLSDLFSIAGFSNGGSEAALEEFTHKGIGYAPVVTITDASGGAGGLYELSVAVEYVTLKTQKAEY